MNKSEVMYREGWTAGRVEKFLTVEYCYKRRGYHGTYYEYEYSEAQVSDAEKTPSWLLAAGKYLKIHGLTHERLLALRQENEKARAERIRKATALDVWLSPLSPEAERMAAFSSLTDVQIEEALAELSLFAANQMATDFGGRIAKQLMEEQTKLVRGGLTLAGFAEPLHDGWRKFAPEEVLPFVEHREKLEAEIDAAWVSEFYTLWKSGEGYCNRLGTVRRIINPNKKRLIEHLKDLAVAERWRWGVKNDVVYYDTPCGQASFHLHWSTPLDGAPEYGGEWSGEKNSQQVLESLFGARITALA